jgi:hypothetical protein
VFGRQRIDPESAKIPLSLEELRVIGLWAADCAERALPLFEAKAPADTRPREAIEGIREFARGGKRTAKLRTVALAALAAAREVDDQTATAVARAAGLAASSAYTHPLATLDNAKHILGPAVYAALAHELAADGDPAAGDSEIRWAVGHTPPQVREVMRRMPSRAPGRSRLDALYFQLDSGLRR